MANSRWRSAEKWATGIGIVTVAVAILAWLKPISPPAGIGNVTQVPDGIAQIGNGNQVVVAPTPPESQTPRSPSQPKTESETNPLAPNAGNKPQIHRESRGDNSSNVATSGSNSPAASQNAPGGISIGRDNNGTAIVNNIGIHRPLLLTEDQQKYVASQLGAFAGQSVELDVDRATGETDAFTKSLMASFSLAHINAARKDAMFVGGCLNYPGVSFMVGTNRLEMANTIWRALVGTGAVEGQGQACSRSGEPDELVINIRPTN